MFNPINVIKTKKAAKAEIRKLELEISRIEKRIENFGESFKLTEDDELAFDIILKQIDMRARITELQAQIDEIKKNGLCVETGLVVA